MELEKRVEALERQVQRLSDIEEIKALKGKYLRCLDTKDWNGIRETFAPNIHTEYSSGKYSFDNADDIVNFLDTSMPKSIIHQHNCHTPEIWFDSDTVAWGYWYLQDYLLITPNNSRLLGTAIYKDRYEKVDGKWLIAMTGYTRIFEETWVAADHQIPTSMHGQ